MSNDKKGFIPEDDETYERNLFKEKKAKRLADAEAAKKAKLELERKKEQERRKQLQQDRIELAKLKNGVIEESETIKEEEKVEIVLTPRQKIANFFYHYKIPLIAGVFAVAVVSFLIYDVATKEKPDVYVLSTCNNGLDYRVDELEEYLEQFCPDVNGDGEICVQVISAPDSEDYDTLSANRTKVYAQLQMDDTVIFLTCDGNYNLTENDEDETAYYFKGMIDDLTQEFPDNESVDVKGYHFYGESIKEALNWEEMPDDIVFSLRIPNEPIHGDAETIQKNYDIALEMLKEIMKDNGDL